VRSDLVGDARPSIEYGTSSQHVADQAAVTISSSATSLAETGAHFTTESLARDRSDLSTTYLAPARAQERAPRAPPPSAVAR